MTQSGQSEEPSQRQAREGIVLPSDGGEPLLPGMLGAQPITPTHQGPPQNGYGYQGGPQAGPYGGGSYPAPQPGPQAPASAPPGAQSWGTPWGPDQQQTPPQQQDQTWPTAPAQQWGTDATQNQQNQIQQNQIQQNQNQWGAPVPDAIPSQPLPQETSQTPYGHQAPATDAYGTPGASLPPGPTGPTTYGAPLPPAQHAAPGAAPLPPADEGATQYIPPVPAAPASEGATQFLPPVAPAVDEGATQFIPPVGPGALPPEVGVQPPSDATQFLGHTPHGGPQAGPGPLPPVADPDSQATQYIAPVTDGTRQTPAEFDNLFRSGPGAGSPAGATQHLPRFEQHQPQHQSAYGQPQPAYFPPGGHGGHDDDGRGGRGGRGRSKVPLIAAVGIGIVVLGVGAGALLSGGGGGDGQDKNQTVSATAPAGDGSASPSADAAKQQAVALDKLLAQSGDSRASVIAAVANVKACRNLDTAASDLRAAAKQRTQLVTSLAGLSVDELPDHAALTTALTQAWQASASADNHYAAWADQVGGNKKGCKKGQARSTGQTQAGNRASGTASQQKAKASQLWNTIAKTYGLTQRQPTQL
ncbi:hypothetical protein ABZ848_22640 [Streptomyces sp. NPDC047081]|uniref:hypothetical protein n=1 Tax=Streptomyces sp. NPDC047081 TaxID=3154706 RepID=UPI0033F89886